MSGIEELFEGVAEKEESTDWLKIIERIDKLLEKPNIQKLLIKLFRKEDENDFSGYAQNPPQPATQNTDNKTEKISGDQIYERVLTLFSYMKQNGQGELKVNDLYELMPSLKSEIIKTIEKD